MNPTFGRSSGRSEVLDLFRELIDHDFDTDAASKAWMERRSHVVTGECIYGCHICGFSERER